MPQEMSSGEFPFKLSLTFRTQRTAMKQIVIDTGSTTGIGAFGLFEKEGLQRGDTLRIVRRPSLSQEAWLAAVMWIMTAANFFLKKKATAGQPPAADDLLNEVAKSGKGLADLQKELKAEHDVSVETDPPVDDDYTTWREFGLHALDRAYSDDEPDISHITLLEPNPDYKPWKPGKLSGP